jgi:hypothetical protein
VDSFDAEERQVKGHVPSHTDVYDFRNSEQMAAIHLDAEHDARTEDDLGGALLASL